MATAIFNTAESCASALKKSDKYSLVLIVSKRARSLKAGANNFLDGNYTKKLKPVQIAIDEIAKGVINKTNFSIVDSISIENIANIVSGVGMINKVPQHKIGRKGNDVNISYQDITEDDI